MVYSFPKPKANRKLQLLKARKMNMLFAINITMFNSASDSCEQVGALLQRTCDDAKQHSPASSSSTFEDFQPMRPMDYVVRSKHPNDMVSQLFFTSTIIIGDNNHQLARRQPPILPQGEDAHFPDQLHTHSSCVQIFLSHPQNGSIKSIQCCKRTRVKTLCPSSCHPCCATDDCTALEERKHLELCVCRT